MTAPPPLPSHGAAVWVPSSPGDLVDRYTILNLKVERADSEAKRRAALDCLREITLPEYDANVAVLVDCLAGINRRLWDLEDAVRRLLDAPGDPAFLEAARAIPIMNDARAHTKQRIDLLMGARRHMEHKTYA